MPKNCSKPSENKMDKKKKVLELVQRGLITPQEATKLLHHLMKTNTVKPCYAYFLVQNSQEISPIVKITVPVDVVKTLLNVFPENAPLGFFLGTLNFDLTSLNWKEIFHLIASGVKGEILSIDLEHSPLEIYSIRIFVQ